MTKQEFRQKFQTTRQKLGKVEREDKSAVISQQLKNMLDWQKVSYIHVYEPISRLAEVDISDFVGFIEREFPNISVYTSRKIAEKWRITSIGGESLDQLPKFDLIVVPMLGFDRNLHRIGYGGGYYDRFLETQPEADKVGVCFDDLQVAELPVEPTDVALHKIVTEKQIYTN